MTTALINPPRENTMLSGDAFTNPAMYEHAKSLAGLLANGAFTPKHLIVVGKPERTLATCTRIVIQALRWGFDIFAVADETYEVHGRLGYQGKLIIAVVNARGNLKEPLNFSYKGTGDNLTVEVIGHFANEDQPRLITLSVKQAKTDNKMWVNDPEQKLAYSGAIKWARRHCPQLVMGVRTVEDLESMTVEAAPTTFSAITNRISAKPPEANGNGHTDVDEAHQPDAPDDANQDAGEVPMTAADDRAAYYAKLKDGFTKAATPGEVKTLDDMAFGPESLYDWTADESEGLRSVREMATARTRKGGKQKEMLPSEGVGQ